MKIYVPTLPKIFRSVTANTLIFLFGPIKTCKQMREQKSIAVDGGERVKVVAISLFYFILRFGPRFLATVDSYDKTLSEIAKLAAVDLKLDNLMQEGVYVMIGGPTFETVAESRLLRNFGADAVGKLFS